MSSALAIAGVTAVLRSMLQSWLSDQDANAALGGPDAEVTVEPVDAVELTGPEATPRLNLYMYQVSPNSGWRNVDLASTDSRGARSKNPPLALDLHYLLTAYGTQALHAEVLLGYGMQLLHMVPVLTREQIAARLPPALQASHLDAQVEMVKLTQESPSTEELSKLWAAFQARYRPTAAYRASVVLIESPVAGRAPLPVLTRDIRVQPDLLPSLPGITAVRRSNGQPGRVQPDLLPSLPGITAVRPPNDQPGVVIGDEIRVEGHRLSGTNRRVRLENRQLDVNIEIAAESGAETGLLRFIVPNEPAALPVGAYALEIIVDQPNADGEMIERTTNRLSLTVLPNILTDLPIVIARDGEGTATISLNFTPQVRTSQRAAIVIGSLEVLAPEPPVPTDTLEFVIADAPEGTFLVRLRVDGYDSLVIADYTATPPVFLDRRVTFT